MNRLRIRRRQGSRVLLGLGLIAAIACFSVAIDLGLVNSLFAPGGETITAHFANTEQLKAGDPVRENGVDVGTVQSMTLDPGGRTATVSMLIESAGQPVYQNATATLRWRTVLGGSYAIDLTPGDSSAGRLGAAIPVSQTSDQVETDDLLSFDQGAARQGLKTMLAQLPAALADPHAPARALNQLADVAPPLSTTLSAVQGRFQRDLAPLVATAAQTMHAFDTPTVTARDVVQSAALTLGTTAGHSSDLVSTIRQLASVQPSVVRTLQDVNGTLSLADPLIARLTAPSGQVGPTLRQLRPTVTTADSLLTRARPLITDLRPAVSSLSATADSARPLLSKLTPSISRVAATILPSLAQTDPVTNMKTYQMIGPAIASLDGAASTFDGQGHLFRFPAIGGQHVLSDDIPCTTYFTDPQAPALIACESLNQALSTYVNFFAKGGKP